MAIEKNIIVETKDVGPIREKKNKRFSYKPNTVSNGFDPYPNVIPIGPIPHERPWWLNDDDDEGKLGIESLDVFKKLIHPL